MLLEVTVGNYRSFREDQTLSLVATKLRSRDPTVDDGARLALTEDTHALASAAIYGANASGKSNFVRAMRFVLDFVRNSAREGQAGDDIDVEPFLFDDTSAEDPSSFELVFQHEGAQYRYGFTVDRAQVHEEWLYRTRKKEVLLFRRDAGRFELHAELRPFADVSERTRANALFLSVAAQLDVPLATQILGWFRGRFRILYGLHDVTAHFSARCIHERVFADQVAGLVRALDVGITDVEVERTVLSRADLPAGVPEAVADGIVGKTTYQVRSVHPVYDADRVVRSTTLPFEEESEGTKKLFALAGPIVDTLATGKILVIDEFDARLHPAVSRRLVELFHDPRTNPHHAQLIIATHDTNLLTRTLFRRDQIWFVEKAKSGASSLYSLASFKVRNDASFEADYFRGRYGAVPFLGGLRRVLIAPDPEAPERPVEEVHQ